MPYGYLGSMRTRPGHRDDVVAILTQGADGLQDAGCLLYLVGTSVEDGDAIWVSEVWQSREHHDASLQLPAVRDQITRAMPMLTGEFTGHEIDVVGGVGLPR